MLSANALAVRDAKKKVKRFRTTLSGLAGLDIALDSAGFVAWMRYGGFPWTVEMYAGQLVPAFPWAWWAQMDACCEPEIAATPHVVRERQVETVRMLGECRRAAEEFDVSPPTPVLQGWTPDDYAWHVDKIRPEEGLVCVGSMCRRNVNGPNGLVAVVERLDKELPPGVTLHLFGVKSQGLVALAQHPRVESVDSMAWDMQARKTARSAGVPFSNGHRISHMRAWRSKQLNMMMTAAPPVSPPAKPPPAVRPTCQPEEGAPVNKPRGPVVDYPTPMWVVDAIIDALGDDLGAALGRGWGLEPACGDGRIIEALKARFPRSVVIGCDISAGAFRLSMKKGLKVKMTNYLSETFKVPPALIITNPPFGKAQEFVEKAIADVADGGMVVMLLRLAFLSSKRRASLHINHPADIYVLSSRPSFIKTARASADRSDVGWFVWRKGTPGGRWSVLTAAPNRGRPPSEQQESEEP